MKKKKWFEVPIAGQRQTVFLGDETDPELGQCEGITNDAQLYVVINGTYADDKIDEIALHELLHVAINLSGAKFLVPKQLKLSAAKWYAAEETLVRTITPVLLACLKECARFKLPPKPRKRKSSKGVEITMLKRSKR